MQSCDFFAFCSSLKRPELKALYDLSWLRHMGRGEVLYRPGDPGNALFIVDRGVVELSPEGNGPSGLPTLYFSRGDLIGDVEVFSQSRRTGLARAHEESTLRCFPRANFAALLRQIPSFFQYACEHMASQVAKARELAGEHHNGLELSGRISTFDLTTIHQTLVNSGQTGELNIKDDQAETVGAFYFKVGRLSAGQFQHLTGDEAFWQLFLIETLTGTFSFSAGEKPLTDWIQAAQITETPGDPLIVALQYRDEFYALKEQMDPGPAKLAPRAPALYWNGESPEHLKSAATQVWDVVSQKTGTISDLYRQCSVCELKIYQVVHELLRSQQLALA